MYFINNGIRHDVYEAIDKNKDEYVYVVVCSDCGDYRIFSEYDFIELVDNGEIDVICEDPDEEDEFSCDGDCDNCEYDEKEDEEDEDEEDEVDLLGDVIEELNALKELMVICRMNADFKSYQVVLKLYIELFKLLK